MEVLRQACAVGRTRRPEWREHREEGSVGEAEVREVAEARYGGGDRGMNM